MKSKFQIVFEGTRTLSSGGYISVDDVVFEECALGYTNRTCTDKEFKCTRGNCVDKDRICDSVDDCGDSSDETLPECSAYSKFDI